MSQILASNETVTGTWRPSVASVIIGKDLLELFSSSMYVEPITIYREYLQNAADSIDAARASGLLSPADKGHVEISIDLITRTVRIHDNGTGIARDEFEERLSAFGASTKRGTNARGFRGVGRLAGLGYCQELVFRSRAYGESEVSEMHWDCKNIKAILRSPENDLNLQEVINRVVTVRHIDGRGWPDHFFEVELRGVVRTRNDALINKAEVYDYLSEVAPVPFSPDFEFGEELTSKLSEYISLGELDIRIEGVNDPVYRPHRNDLKVRGGIHDSFTEIEFCRIPSVDDQVGAIGWFLHHGYKGAIPTSQISGLRLRSGNIQVGGHNLLQNIFAEPRFNSWSVGEIHPVDKRIVPNGRRDNYEQNVHFNNLANHLSPIARRISAQCRHSSILRSLLLDFNRRETLTREKLQVVRQGSLSSGDLKKQIEEIDEQVIKMQRIVSRGILPEDVQKSLKRKLKKLEKELANARGYDTATSPLAQLSPCKRKAYEQVFGLIYEYSSNQASAYALVQHIIGKLR